MPTILERVATGDRAAVQECIDAYGGLVWSLARRLAPSGAEPDDAVQEIFIALWRNAARFEPARGSEWTFVATLARRKLIDLRRRLARHTAAGELHEDLAQDAASGGDPTERAAVCDEAARANAALQQLRPEQQRVLRLAVFQGLSHQEISGVTGLPLGTVKTHARRGLMRIREMLGLDAVGVAKGATP